MTRPVDCVAITGSPSLARVRSMFEALRELVAHRELVYVITWREIRVKYKQSVMGMLWAILMPLVIVSAGFIVRFAFSKISGKPLALTDLTSVAVKAAPWAFFVSAIRFGTNCLVANSSLVTKIYVPRLVFPISAVLSQLFDLVIAGVVISLMMLVTRAGVSLQLLWLPVLLGPLVLLATALAIIFSAASLFFRDVKYIVEVLLTFAIFFTPVLYDSSMFGPRATLLLVNPVSPLLEGLASAVVLHQCPSLRWLSYSIVCSTLLFAVALWVFRKFEPYFAESI
jgi:ABC-type polysaccharide/polyol phosphate export permease